MLFDKILKKIEFFRKFQIFESFVISNILYRSLAQNRFIEKSDILLLLNLILPPNTTLVFYSARKIHPLPTELIKKKKNEILLNFMMKFV